MAIATPVNAEKRISDEEQEIENLMKIAEEQHSIENPQDAEFVVEGATVKCSNSMSEGLNSVCQIKLINAHGYYVNDMPVINAQDKDIENMRGFGYCGKSGKLCAPQLSEWQNTDENTLMYDSRTLKAEPAVLYPNSYCICQAYGGTVSPVSSGQEINTEVNVYITSDKKAIMVDGIRYDIYNPYSAADTEDWYPVLTFELTEMDFSLFKALTGIELSVTDYTRQEVVTYSNQTIEYSNGKVQISPVGNQIISGQTESGSSAAKAVLALAAMDIALNILESFANALTYTTLYLYFQKTVSEKYRVILLGKTNHDFKKYMTYQYYKRNRSFLDTVVPSNLKYVVKDDINVVMKELIESYLSMIKDGKTRARLLVDEENLWLGPGEYYDMVAYLLLKRKGKKHYVYIHEEGGYLYQKHITWPGESLAIVKRSFGKITKLIELIDDTSAIQGNEKYFRIFEKVLQDSDIVKEMKDLKDEQLKASPSNATSIAGTFSSPETIYDLENMKG